MTDLSTTTSSVAFGLSVDTTWPGWIIPLAAIALFVLTGWMYGPSQRWSRQTMLLAFLRIVAVLSLLFVLLQPTFIFSRDYKPRSTLTIAIDTTASMGRADVLAAGGRARTRLSAVVSRLADPKGSPLRRLLDTYDVQLAAVGERVVSRLSLTGKAQWQEAAAWLNALKPDLERTDLASSVQQILAMSQPDQVAAGLVLISDGRRTAGAPLSTTAEQLAWQHCPAIAVAVGSDRPLPDLSLSEVEAPPRVFVNEPVAIRGRLDVVGVSQSVDAMVKLIDPETGKALSQQSVTVSPDAAAPAGQFALMYRPDRASLRRLLVKAESSLQEINLGNNASAVQVEATDARIRVLYVDDLARFEYRYLKNLLLREPMIVSSCLLLSADPEFPQEGTEPIQRFPATFDDLDSYDVVILGDLDPQVGWAGPQGLAHLARWVEQKGGGLAWLAGSRNSVEVWRNTPLGKLLPMRALHQPVATQPAIQPYRPVLTPEGLRSPIFLLDAQGDPSMPADELVRQLPPWQWAASVGPATPAAQTLAVHPLLRTPDVVPVIVAGRYGAGRTFFCGGDDVWRWRRFRDIEPYRSFWLQTIRWLAGPRKLGAYRPVALEASPSMAVAGQPVNFSLRISDARLADDLPERMSLAIRSSDAAQSLWLQRVPNQAVYTGTATVDRAGSYTAQAQVAAAPPATAGFTVRLPEAETADSPADPAALQQWVQATKGAGGEGYMTEMDRLEQLASLPLPQAQVRTHVTEVRLWDNWLALAVVAGLFLTEWAWRRSRGLA